MYRLGNANYAWDGRDFIVNVLFAFACMNGVLCVCEKKRERGINNNVRMNHCVT
jgi:hypothetical protein